MKMYFGILIIYCIFSFNWSFTLKSNSNSFYNAFKNCESENGHLLTIENKDELDEVVLEMESQKIPEAWIGLTSFANNLKSYWVSGYSAELLVVNWDRPRIEECVSIQRNSMDFANNSTYILKSRECSHNLPFICYNTTQMAQNETDLENSSLTCPDQFFELDGDCFMMISKKLSWKKSKHACESTNPNAHLAIIRNTKQLYGLKALLNKHRKNMTKQVWIGLKYDDQFVTGPERYKNQIAFTNWGSLQPSQINDNKDSCVHMCLKNDVVMGDYRGNWFLKNCEHEYSSLCSINANSTHTFSSKETGKLFNDKTHLCPDGFVLYGNTCYNVHTDKLVTKQKGKELCAVENASHIHPQSNIEVEVPLYLLLNKSAGSRNNYMWLDWELGVRYTNDTMSMDFPRNLNLNRLRIPISQIQSLQKTVNRNMCLRVHSDNRLIEAVDCNQETAACLCYINADQSNNLFNKQRYNYDKPSSIQYSCPTKWFLFNDRCYHIDNTNPYRRNESLYDCKSINKDLDTNDDSNIEFDFVNLDKKLDRYLDETGIQDEVWIGLEAWIQNDMIVFNWYNGEPIRHLSIDLSSFHILRQRTTRKTWTKWCAVKSTKHGWKFVNCDSYKARMFCVRKPGILFTTSSTSTTTKRPTTKSWRYITGHVKQKFEVMHDPVQWEHAKYRCEQINTNTGYVGSLAYFNSYQEMKEIGDGFQQNYLDKKFWIGLKGVYNRFDNSFLSWTLNKRLLETANGSHYSELTFQNYDKMNLYNQYYDTDNKIANCVAFQKTDLKWHIHSCNNSYRPLCRYTLLKPGSLSNNPTPTKRFIHSFPKCPKGFVEHNFKCYRVVHDLKLDWYQSEGKCREMQSNLVVIESKYENSFVYSLLSENYRNSLENSSYWIYGKPTSIVDTNYQVHSEPCPAISGSPDPYIGARWFRDDCLRKRKFICFVTLNKTQANFSKKPFCRQFDNILGRSCYKVMQDPGKSYKEAQSLARSLGSMGHEKLHLTSLVSHYHTHFLLNVLEMAGVGRDLPVLLGIRVPKNHHDWAWDHGMAVRYTIWNRIPQFTRIKQTGCFLFYQEMTKGKIGMVLNECSRREAENFPPFVLVFEEIYPKENSLLNYNEQKKSCVSPENSAVNKIKQYAGTISQTVDGEKCVRWDLSKSFNFKLKREWQKFLAIKRRHDRVPSFVEYHSNECRYLPSLVFQNRDDKMVKLWCQVLQNNTGSSPKFQFKECKLQICPVSFGKTHKHEFNQTHHKITGLLVCFFFIFLIVCLLTGIVMCRRYQQSFPSFSSSSRRNPLFRMMGSMSGDSSSTAVVYARGTSFNNPIYKPVSSASG